jgi:hypothetical protein
VHSAALPVECYGEINPAEYDTLSKRWSRLSEQNLRVDKWSVCRG